ncbi:MAG: hypothetical protein ACREFE_14730 [Limisphaerales bacterium]
MTTLLQTRVPSSLARAFKQKARHSGVSAYALLARLVRESAANADNGGDWKTHKIPAGPKFKSNLVIEDREGEWR